MVLVFYLKLMMELPTINKMCHFVFIQGGVNPISPKNSCERTEPLPAHPSERDQNVPHMFDSFEEASRLFECLIHPVKPEKFFR